MSNERYQPATSAEEVRGTRSRRRQGWWQRDRPRLLVAPRQRFGSADGRDFERASRTRSAIGRWKARLRRVGAVESVACGTYKPPDRRPYHSSAKIGKLLGILLGNESERAKIRPDAAGGACHEHAAHGRFPGSLRITPDDLPVTSKLMVRVRFPSPAPIVQAGHPAFPNGQPPALKVNIVQRDTEFGLSGVAFRRQSSPASRALAGASTRTGSP
jgi:hypothetical protein